MLRLRGERHERRHGSRDRALQFRHDGADARPTADGTVLVAMPTTQTLITVVVIDAADDRANGHELVERRRDAREGLADLDAGNLGATSMRARPKRWQRGLLLHLARFSKPNHRIPMLLHLPFIRPTLPLICVLCNCCWDVRIFLLRRLIPLWHRSD